MASHEANTATGVVHFKNAIGPLTTTGWCYALSIVFGLLFGLLVVGLWLVTPLPKDPYTVFFGYFGIATYAGYTFWNNCEQFSVELAHVAVPTLAGKPVYAFPLGEDRDTNPQRELENGRCESKPSNMYLFAAGNHRLPPYVRGVTVKTKRDTSDARPVRAMSRDGTLMGANVTFDRTVVNPYFWLHAQDPDGSVFGIAEMGVENTFPCLCTDEFKDSDKKDEVIVKIERKIDEDDWKFGLNVEKVHMSEVLPPQEVLDANARLQIEIAQAIAEEKEWEGVLARVEQLLNKYPDMDVNAAFGRFQAERGKAQANDNTHRLEGLDPLVKVLGAIIERRN